MIVFDLECRNGGHRFEGWFASSEDFRAQAERGVVACPVCQSHSVAKAPMAPNVARKGNQKAVAPVGLANPAKPSADLIRALAVMQAEALKESRWVGNEFAEVSRAIHYGEREAETVHGQATASEARALADEGVGVLPLPFPVAPPEGVN